MLHRLLLCCVCCAALAGCVSGDGPFGRIFQDVEEGVRKAGEDLEAFKREVRDSRNPDAARRGLPLRLLVLYTGATQFHEPTLLLDLHRSIRKLGFEIIKEEVPATARYRQQGSRSPARLRDLATGLPSGSLGVLEVITRGWTVNRKGSLQHSQITGQARFKLTFRYAANWRHSHSDDPEYWESRETVERAVTDRQLTFLEDQLAQDLNMPQSWRRDPELRAAYVSGVIAEAFDRIIASGKHRIRAEP